MSKRGWCFFLFLTWTAALAAATPPPRLRIGVEKNSEPLSFLDAKGQPTGFTADLVKEMTKHGDFQAEVVSSYWSTILREFNAGRLDVLANVNITAERRATMDFSISHAYLHGIVYLRRDHAPIKKAADLAGLKLAVLQGSVTTYTAMENHGWGATVQGFGAVEAMLQAVENKECDAALLMLPLATGVKDHGLRGEFLSDITYQFYFAVHKGDTDSLARLNESLAAARQNGEFDRLWRTWIGPIEPHPIRLADLRPYFVPIAMVLLAVGGLFGWQRQVLAKVSGQAAALRESEERFRSTFDNAGTGMALVDPAGQIMRSNSIFQKMLGYSEAEIGQRTFMDVTYPADLKSDVALYQEVLTGKRDTYQIEKRYIRKDGRTIWGHLTVSIVRNATGAPLYAVSMVEDITEHKRIQDALQLSQERLQAILDHSPAMIYVKNLEGRYLMTNRLFNEKFKHDGASMIGMTIRDLVPPAEAELRESHDRLVLEKGAPITLEEQSTENGVPKTYLAAKFPLRDAQGTIYAIGGVDTDITEYELLQTQFAQAQKMDAFGQLAGGIAHDFNNILAVLMIQLSLLASEPTLPEPVVTKLKGLEDITQKAARLTRQLLMFSRREATSMQVMDLNQALVDVFKMLGRILGEHIDMTFKNRSVPMWINADAGMMEQVVMNLCVNARDAMPEGGRLLVDTETVEIRPEAADETRRAGRFVCLTVTDTGHGMDAATLKRIFEPFFTTKEVGKGTGLGLATVYGIVKQHAGWVEVESTVGKGSTFRVFLPAVAGPYQLQTENKAPDVKGGKERILIVEDDPAVREISAMCLEQVGYSVVATSNAIEGLEKWEESGQRFDLLLTDMIMPGGMSGLKLATRLKQMKNSLRVIIVSGYSQEASNSRTPFTDVGTYLAKPIDRVTLLAAVRRSLDGG